MKVKKRPLTLIAPPIKQPPEEAHVASDRASSASIEPPISSGELGPKWKYVLGRRVLLLWQVASISMGHAPSNGAFQEDDIPAGLDHEWDQRVADLTAWLAPCFEVDGNRLLVEHPLELDLEDAIDCYVDARVGLRLLREKYPDMPEVTATFEASISDGRLGEDSGAARKADPLCPYDAAPLPDASAANIQAAPDTALRLLITLVDSHVEKVTDTNVRKISKSLARLPELGRFYGQNLDESVVRELLSRASKLEAWS